MAVRDSADTYLDYIYQCKTVRDSIKDCLDNIKSSSLRYCLNCRTLQTVYNANSLNGAPTNGYIPIFTPIEAAEMSKYIYEGRWENENVVFSDTYSPDDIINTLIDLMDASKDDLDNLYSKPQYDFEVELADMVKHRILNKACERLYLGNGIRIHDGDTCVEPILLQLHLSYGDEKSKMSFTTNYERKPLETRFSEMFATINQVSVTSPQYIYEE